MQFADFLIDGSPPDELGVDVQPGTTVALRLANAPALDSARVAYSVVIASLGAPDVVLDPPTGRPATPTGVVKVTFPPKGVHSYLLQCEVNEGRNARGELDASFTRQRLVAIRSPLAGLRKLLPAESTQYDPRGWSDEQNREVDQVEEALGSIGGNVIAGLGLTKTGSTFDVGAGDGSIAVGADSISVGVLQTDAQHGSRGGGALHTPADAAAAGFLSPAHFTLLAGATAAATGDALLRRGAAGEGSLAALLLGAGGPQLLPAGAAAQVRSPNGLLTTIAAADAGGVGTRLIDAVVGSVTTSNANAATVVSYKLPDNSIALARAEVIAFAPANGACGVFERRLGVKRVAAGPATPVGAVQAIGADGEDVAAWNATMGTSGAEVRVQVSGVQAVDIAWFARLAVIVFSP